MRKLEQKICDKCFKPMKIVGCHRWFDDFSEGGWDFVFQCECGFFCYEC